MARIAFTAPVRHTRWLVTAASVAAMTWPLAAQAQIAGITDPVGDFLPSFAGASSQIDLDVLSASAYYNPATSLFTLVATMAGPIGSTANAAYIWGVNRGAGVTNAGFVAIGIDGVRFDRTISLLPAGTGTVGGVGALPAGSVSISGNTISANIPLSFLPANGFANPLDYTWNLWPRNNTFSGVPGISDFAPNNANFSTSPIPEPATWALMAGGLALLGAVARRRSC